MSSRSLVVAAVLVLGLLADASQAAPEPGVDWLWGGGFHLGLPTGEFAAAADEGYGLAGHCVAMPHGLPVGLRGEVSALVYGSRTFEGNGGGHTPEGELRTDTWFGNMLLGPELRLRGGPVRPYLHVLAGLGYFATTSELSGGWASAGPGTTHFDDTTFAWAAGGGVAVALGRSTSLDIGVRYLANGPVDYFTEQQIPAAGVPPGPRHGDVHVVTFTVGVAFGR